MSRLLQPSLFNSIASITITCYLFASRHHHFLLSLLSSRSIFIGISPVTVTFYHKVGFSPLLFERALSLCQDCSMEGPPIHLFLVSQEDVVDTLSIQRLCHKRCISPCLLIMILKAPPLCFFYKKGNIY